MGERTRRHMLRLVGSGLAATLAGCAGPGGEGEEEGGGEEGGGGGEEEDNIEPAFNDPNDA